jgi:CRISPR-associated protein Cmr2
MRQLHFTLGPVQSFVSQARRTRDFWAGSFLLSWLSGVAMVATETLGGTIEFPIPPDGYLKRIRGEGDHSFKPRIGAIPNRFKASIPDDFGPEQAVQVAEAVRLAWMVLGWKVWGFDGLADLAESHDTLQPLWERQHRHFWDITWVITENNADAAALDRRKNWRSHIPPPEPGVKCHLMEGLQELSAIEDMTKAGNKRRKEFWEVVRGLIAAGGKGKNDLGEKEMLCAVAYVKRRFAHVFDELNETIPLGEEKRLTLKGWKLAPGMPSVSYMAAVQWLEKLVTEANLSQLQALHTLALEAGAEHGEWTTRIRCLEQAIAKKPQDEQAETRRCIALDGNIFFKHVQESPTSYELEEDETRAVGHWLDVFRKEHDTFAKTPLSPFYAVLMMDGDNLGQHMSQKANQNPIALALNAFTEAAAVPKIVAEHNGMLIYAGGDDVLALLPLEDALACAAALRKQYADCFQASGIPTTLSGAIIFAHVKTALGEVLRQAHTVLDEVAKDGAGRDAIAVRVLKPGGEHLTWARPWDVAMPDGQEPIELVSLAAQF